MFIVAPVVVDLLFIVAPVVVDLLFIVAPVVVDLLFIVAPVVVDLLFIVAPVVVDLLFIVAPVVVDLLFIVAHTVYVSCVCSSCCHADFTVLTSFAIILLRKRELAPRLYNTKFPHIKLKYQQIKTFLALKTYITVQKISLKD